MTQKMNIISSRQPKNICILDLLYIPGDFLKNVIEFLDSKYYTDFDFISMAIQKEYGKSNVDLQYQTYKDQFKNVGYNLFTRYQHESYVLVANKFEIIGINESIY